MNALSHATLAALREAFVELATMPDLRCALLRSSGDQYFAAGGDLVELADVRSDAQITAMADHARGALDAVRECPVAVVAVLNGDAIGGGAELAVACDFRIMRLGAHIGFIQGRLAISSAWGGGPDLGALLGPARSLRMTARSELIDADTALAWGLVDGVAAVDDLEATLGTFVQPVIRQSGASLSAFVAQSRALRRGADYAARRQLERDALLETWAGADHWAAVERFMSRKRA
jgi:enoyl-CoA hydratase